MKIFENSEGIEKYNINPDWWKNRIPGLSVFYRVKNEGEFIKPSILSIIDHVDEVIIVLQPSEDSTREQIESIKNPKIKLFDYPFKIMPNGDGFINQDASSVHNRAYFFNWALSKTTRNWALEWDGDMVALSGIYKHLKDGTREKTFYGHEIVKIEKDGDWYLSGTHPISNSAPPGMFKIKEDLAFVKSKKCEVFYNPDEKLKLRVDDAYVHLKWCKAFFKDAWKENWAEDNHFRNIVLRAKPGNIYRGEKPKILVDNIKFDMGETSG